MNEIVKLVNNFSPLPVLITSAYALLVYKQLTRELKVFCWFIFASGLVQLLSSLLWFQSKNNLPLLHLYVAGGFICLAWFYSSVLKNFISQKIIWGAATLFTIFTLTNSLFIQNIYTFNSHALTTESVLIIIFSLFTFIVLMNDIVKEKRIHLIKSLNWINSGLFIYYTSSLMIFYFGEIITHTFSKSMNRYTWFFHSFFSLAMYFCFFVGLWKRPRHDNSGRVS